jgi:hypothetical protein
MDRGRPESLLVLLKGLTEQREFLLGEFPGSTKASMKQIFPLKEIWRRVNELE